MHACVCVWVSEFVCVCMSAGLRAAAGTILSSVCLPLFLLLCGSSFELTTYSYTAHKLKHWLPFARVHCMLYVCMSMCTLVCARVDLKVCHIKRTWYAILCVPNYSKSDDICNDNPPTVIVMGDRQDQLIFLGIHRYSLLMRWVKYIECKHTYLHNTYKQTYIQMYKL